MEKDEIRLFNLISQYLSGNIEFNTFYINWDNLYVESEEDFESEEVLSEIKDKLDYTSNQVINERNKTDGIISVEEFTLFLYKIMGRGDW